MTHEEEKKYTYRTTEEHLIATEEHLIAFLAKELACLQCLEKHMAALSGLAKEGMGIFADKKSEWSKLLTWTEEQRDIGFKNITEERAKEMIEFVRYFRKEILPVTICPECLGIICETCGH